MLAVFFVSVSPNPPKLPEIWQMDKVAHFGAYSVMGLLWARALNSGPGRAGGLKASWRAALAVIVIALFGAFIEVCQMYVPGRSAEVMDALANGAGGFSGVVVYGRIMRRLRRSFF
ncbi:MAG: VanZ family protein [Deltaproteobacteria bacterium]|nr:VanZ family protein [Deltaproteobacteria bacterium]